MRQKVIVGIILVFVLVIPTSGVGASGEVIEEIFIDSLFKRGGTHGTQRSPQIDFTVLVNTSGVLKIQYFVYDMHCSSIRLHVLLDDIEMLTTEWLGWIGHTEYGPLDTGLLDLGPVVPGSYNLTLSPEGKISGCNDGSLYSWGGSLRIVYSRSVDVQEVTIDIKPGGYPNSINLKSRGVTPVAIITTEGFDASNVNPNTVLFANAIPLSWTLEDVDSDGDMDLLFHFKTQNLNLTMESTVAYLVGLTYDDEDIQGFDTVKIVPRGGKKQ